MSKDNSDRVSPDMLRAQERLQQKRQATGIKLTYLDTPSYSAETPAEPVQTTTQPEPQISVWLKQFVDLVPIEIDGQDSAALSADNVAELDLPSDSTPAYSAEIPTYSQLNTAAIQAKDVASYRVWLFLHHVFNRSGGRQCVTNAEIEALLCCHLKLFGRRQWRTIRKANEDIYWRRTKNGEYWILGAPDVMIYFNLTRCGRRVLVPVGELVQAGKGGVKRARTALYATWHTARPLSLPVSRETLAEETGLSRTTQWRLEKESAETKTQIEATSNIVLVAPIGTEAADDAAYKHGEATFVFIDWSGHHGTRKAKYLARISPNSYETNQTTAPRGRRRKLNQRLKSRVRNASADRLTEIQKTYYETSGAAAKAFGKGHETAIYPTPIVSVSGCQFWQQIEGGVA